MRFLPLLTLSVAAAALGACGGDDAGRVTTQAPPPTASAPAQTAAAEPLAFGYTRAQLEDADIRAADGAELGEVEALITDASGALIGLAVEVDGPDPDPVVRLPLDGLTPVLNGDDRDLQTTMTAEQLRALPVWQRP